MRKLDLMNSLTFQFISEGNRSWPSLPEDLRLLNFYLLLMNSVKDIIFRYQYILKAHFFSAKLLEGLGGFYYTFVSMYMASLMTQSVGNLLALKEICLEYKRLRFDPWVRKIPWGRKWEPTPIFLPGKPHGQRRLVCYSSWDRKSLK